MKKVTLTESQIKGMFKAYENGITLEAISILFKIEKHQITNMVNAYKCGKSYDTRRI